MYREQLRNALYNATTLVSELLAGRRTVEEFAQEYGNFFHYEALDGHEAEPAQKAVLKGFRAAVSFHERVQTEVVDLLYLGEADKDQYFAPARIGADEARERLGRLAAEHRVNDLLQALQG